MIRGLYTATAGMLAGFRRQMIVADNIANISTTGYKQGTVEFSAAPEMQIFNGKARGGMGSLSLGSVGVGTQLGDAQPSLIQGDLMETGNPLDIAITGSAFLAIQTPNGVLYTRDGTLFRDSLGRLARPDGGLVLGEGGPIEVGEGDVLIDGDGTVRVNGESVGRIELFDLSGPLKRAGNNYLTSQDPTATPVPAEDSMINQGYLEKSNVDVSQATVDMMAVARLYEASQRMASLQDQTLDKAVNEVGRV